MSPDRTDRPEPLFVDIKDVQAQLNISEAMVRKLIQRGILAGRHIGRRHMVLRESFENYLAALQDTASTVGAGV